MTDIITRAREWVQRSRETWTGTTPGPWTTSDKRTTHPIVSGSTTVATAWTNVGVGNTPADRVPGPLGRAANAHAIAAAPTEAQEAREIIEALLEQNAALTAQVEVKDMVLLRIDEIAGNVGGHFGKRTPSERLSLIRGVAQKALAFTPADALAQKEREAEEKRLMDAVVKL